MRDRGRGYQERTVGREEENQRSQIKRKYKYESIRDLKDKNYGKNLYASKFEAEKNG